MDILKKISVISKHNTGDMVKAREEHSSDMYIVIDGVLSMTIYDQRNGGMVAQMNIGKGAFFGGLALIANVNRYIEVVAQAPCTMLFIPFKQVEEYRRYLREEGEQFYQSLMVKAEKFGEMLRSIELEYIKKMYQPKKMSDYNFYSDPMLNGMTMDVLSSNYILNKKMKCPVCMEEFSTETVRTSRLQLRKRGELFVNEYKDVEPLWFDIIVCPSCYYAERIASFGEAVTTDVDAIYKVLLDIKSSIMFHYSKNRTAAEVINAYMIYEKCIQTKNVHVKDRARSSILIAELFSRINYKEDAEQYYEKALACYKQMIDGGVLDVDDLQMQQLYIIYGKLYERKGMTKEAIEQYKNAKVMFRVPDKRYTNIAESYLYNLTYS